MGKKCQLEGRTRTVIPNNLVGTNRRVITLREAVSQNYSADSEIEYSDGYLKELNAMYPFASIFQTEDSGRGNDSRELRHFVANMLGSFTGKSILESVLRRSFEVKRWHPYILGLSNMEYLERVKILTKFLSPGSFDYFTGPSNKQRDLSGVALAKKNGLVFVSAYSAKMIVIPSQNFIESLCCRLINEVDEHAGDQGGKG